MYRRRPPPDVRKALGKTNWLKTWRPGTSLAEVEREARQLTARYDQEIARARGDVEAIKIAEAEEAAKRILRQETPGDAAWLLSFMHEHPEDYAHQINALSHGGTFQPETFSLTEALARDRERHSGDTDARPFTYAVASFVDLVGDLDVSRISRDDVSAWLAGQRRDGLSPATIKRRYGTLKAMIGRALLDLGSDKRNPFDGFKVTEGDGTTKRVPFNKAMLELIEDYLASGRVGFEVVALIRIMRATGGTIGEVGGLVAGDVNLNHAVPHLLIRPNRLRRLKTAARTRPVPLVDSAALEAATLAVDRAGGKGQLFRGFHLERGADLLSAKVVKAIRASGVPKSPRLTAHSFRHTVAEALRASGASFHLQRRLLGHAARDESDIYGADRARLEELAGALEKALEHLGDVDDSIYSEQERMK
jgi:integrase